MMACVTMSMISLSARTIPEGNKRLGGYYCYYYNNKDGCGKGKHSSSSSSSSNCKSNPNPLTVSKLRQSSSNVSLRAKKTKTKTKMPFCCHCSSLSSSSSSSSSSSAVSVSSAAESDEAASAKFDWFGEWYPVMPVCDLDKRAPHAKRVMGLDLVVWWDRNLSAWSVFDDVCPHRLAPLSEGRIDARGRLQCSYHGWCFDGCGACTLIPQAESPAAHQSSRARVGGVYPSTVQNGIVWFWPNSGPEHSDILLRKRPPFLPELDDPSYTALLSNRDINYGYEVLVENLMDPAHVPYAHYGILKTIKPETRVDREGGRPLNLSVEHLDIHGITGTYDFAVTKWFAPCVLYSYPPPPPPPPDDDGPTATKQGQRQRRPLLLFICIPVSPGKSRIIWSFPRNFAIWADRLIPRWVYHLTQNLVLDSDLFLLHKLEHKVMEFGPSNWQKACFVPTKSDTVLVAFRRWLNKYSGGQVDWGPNFNAAALPPTPPKEVLLDRYWTHVVNCSSCRAAYKALNVAKTLLQLVSIAFIGVVALTQPATMTTLRRALVLSVAVLCFAASKWLSHFVYKNFHFHDYNHALV